LFPVPRGKRQPSRRISRSVSTKTITAKSGTGGRLDPARDQSSAFRTVAPGPVYADRLRRLERIRPQRVIHDAQTQTTHRPHENATYRARLDNADPGVANDAGGRKGNEAVATEATTNKGRSSPRRESENNAAELVAETAGRLEWANAAPPIEPVSFWSRFPDRDGEGKTVLPPLIGVHLFRPRCTFSSDAW
jgi:hypothetical protein